MIWYSRFQSLLSICKMRDIATCNVTAWSPHLVLEVLVLIDNDSTFRIRCVISSSSLINWISAGLIPKEALPSRIVGVASVSRSHSKVVDRASDHFDFNVLRLT